MSGPHLSKNVATEVDFHSTAGEMGISSPNGEKRNKNQDLSHLSCCTERASSIQTSALYDDLCTKVSEECQSSPEILNLTMCSGIDRCMNTSDASVQVYSCGLLNSDVSEHFDQQLNLNVANETDVIKDRNSCTATVDSCLQNPSEIDNQSDHCMGSLMRSNSFTETLSVDQLHVLCTATRKLTSSPKPVLRRHSMTFSRTKKQVTIEANAKVIEIDTGASECQEIESAGTASTVDSTADCTLISENDFSPTYSASDNCQDLLNVSEEMSRNSLSLGNLPLSAERMSVSHGTAAVLQEVPVGIAQKDINASDTETSPSHGVELTSSRVRPYEVKCVEKPCVRHLVEDDDDSCGDEADDESTANEEELETEGKEEREHKRKRRKSVEDEIEKVVSSSPNGRFLKFDWEIGCGAFKTVYKGLDSETGVHVAWCELQVCNSCFISLMHMCNSIEIAHGNEISDSYK